MRGELLSDSPPTALAPTNNPVPLSLCAGLCPPAPPPLSLYDRVFDLADIGMLSVPPGPALTDIVLERVDGLAGSEKERSVRVPRAAGEV